uniref:G_PROTEIN_RECEP_F1_2 domain-containing protein n=1 Tax=Panagrellus redivivus TaxID=6233 RepID=A0A7E4UPB5_PANRE
MEAYQVCFGKTRLWPSLIEKLSIGIPITATVVLSFLANAYIAAIILTRLRVMIIAGKIHYLLANVCLAQCIYLSAHFLSSLPSIFSPTPIFNEPTMLILAAPNTIGYYTVLLSNLFIAIDRFVSLFAANFYSKQATTLGIVGISLVWLLSTVISALQADAGCHKRFNQWLMVYSYGKDLNTAACQQHANLM